VESRPEPVAVDRDPLSIGALRGASLALMVTGVIGGVALLLALLWPWLAWGYVVASLGLGFALYFGVSRSEKSLEREVERVRQQHRSGEAPTGGF
jgi:uncharacterized protein (DUF58 family)